MRAKTGVAAAKEEEENFLFVQNLQATTRTTSRTTRTTTNANASGSIESLERELEFYVRLENYQKAAETRDALKRLREDDVKQIELCNSRFYQAFRNADEKEM